MTTTQTDGGRIPTWTLGERLRKARLTASVSPEEMAAEIGRTERTIRNYEAGVTQVPLLVIRQYAWRCGVPVDWLEGGDSPPNGPDTIGYPYTMGWAA